MVNKDEYTVQPEGEEEHHALHWPRVSGLAVLADVLPRTRNWSWVPPDGPYTLQQAI